MKRGIIICLFGVWVLSLNSCQRVSHTTQTAGNRSKIAALPESEMWRDKRRLGIDFVAAGNVPADWTMDIDFSKQIIFRPLSGSALIAAMPKPRPIGTNSGVLLSVGAKAVRNEPGTLLASAGKKNYSTRTGPARLGGLKVFIEPVVSRNTETGRTYAYTVRVETGGRNYVGYGAFIKGSNRLNGTWTLETLRGQRVRAGQFPSHELPQISINLADNTLEGTTGCNKIKGDVQADGDHVQFSARTTTSKKCGGLFEAEYLAALGSVSLFRIGKDQLTLLANGQYVMTFRTETPESTSTGKAK